jgi:hypothetical protein
MVLCYSSLQGLRQTGCSLWGGGSISGVQHGWSLTGGTCIASFSPSWLPFIGPLWQLWTARTDTGRHLSDEFCPPMASHLLGTGALLEQSKVSAFYCPLWTRAFFPSLWPAMCLQNPSLSVDLPGHIHTMALRSIWCTRSRTKWQPPELVAF